MTMVKEILDGILSVLSKLKDHLIFDFADFGGDYTIPASGELEIGFGFTARYVMIYNSHATTDWKYSFVDQDARARTLYHGQSKCFENGKWTKIFIKGAQNDTLTIDAW